MTTFLLALVLAAAQADASPSQSPAAAAQPRAAQGPAAAQPPAGAPAAQPPGVVAIASAADARKLCDALAPDERLRPEGSVVDRADAEARRDADREKALAGRYRITVPGDALRFTSYSAEEGALSLSRHAAPATADGAVRLRPVEEYGLPVRADPATARRILAAQAARKLALNVAFVVPEDEEAPCFHLAGAGGYTVAAEPFAWEYVSDGAVLARGGQGSDRPVVSAKDGARPRVELGKPVEEGSAAAIAPAVQRRLRDLEGCYRTALDRDPWVDGAIVAAVDASARAADRVRIAAESVGNDALVGCVRDALARMEAPGGGGRAYLPIHFELEPPAAPSAAQ